MESILKSLITRILWLIFSLQVKANKPVIIAVTGSIGKTSTVNNILEILGRDNCIGGAGYNTQIGVPLIVNNLKTPKNTFNIFSWLIIFYKMLVNKSINNKKYWVLEIGIDKPGEMDFYTKRISADVVVITGVTGVHLEKFKSEDVILEEKWKLASICKNILIINTDFKILADKAIEDHSSGRLREGINLIGYGTNSDERFNLNMILRQFDFSFKDNKSSFTVDENGSDGTIKSLSFESNLFSKASAICMLPAIYIAKHFSVNEKTTIERISGISEFKGRGRVIKGVYNTTIIDSSYNSSPMSLRALVDQLENTEEEYIKIFAIGQINELGEDKNQIHEELGEYLASKCDYLYTVGELANRYLSSSAKASNNKLNTATFNTSEELGDSLHELLNNLYKKDKNKKVLILFKGSQSGVLLERAIYRIVDSKSRDLVLSR